MKNKNFIEGVAIIGKYINQDGFNVAAGHDQIWSGSIEIVTDQKDIDLLKELGWFKEYDSWSCFT